MGSTQPAEVTEQLRAVVEAIEQRGSVTSDLPPLSADAHQAAAAALRLLRYRPRSEHELRQRLIEKEWSVNAVDEAISRIRLWGLVNDAEFAREWVQGRRKRRGKSAGALERELHSKGVAQQHISAALDQIDEDDDIDSATGLVATRLARRNPDIGDGPSDPRWIAERRRLVAYLERRGYPQAMVLRVVDAQLASHSRESS